jgi:hypothetical protein
MAAKAIDLEGFGKIMINPINFKDREYETVDMTGQPLEHKTIGQRARTAYVTKEGIEIPNNKVCKKMSIEGEELIVPKLSPTKEVANGDIEILEDNGLIYSAIERKVYYVVTDNEKIKDLVLKQHKTLQFPAAFGSGWKGYNALLTYWNDKIILVGCRGDLRKEMDKYSEETVSIEIEIAPQNMKKIVKAMCV